MVRSHRIQILDLNSSRTWVLICLQLDLDFEDLDSTTSLQKDIIIKNKLECIEPKLLLANFQYERNWNFVYLVSLKLKVTLSINMLHLFQLKFMQKIPSHANQH